MTMFRNDLFDHDEYADPGPTGDPWGVRVVSWLLLLVALPGLLLWIVAAWVVDRCRR